MTWMFLSLKSSGYKNGFVFKIGGFSIIGTGAFKYLRKKVKFNYS